MIFLRKRINKNMCNYSNTLLRKLLNNKVIWIIYISVIINSIWDLKLHKRNNKLWGIQLISMLILVINCYLLLFKKNYRLVRNLGLMQIRLLYLCNYQISNIRNVRGQKILIFLLQLMKEIIENEALLWHI